MIEVTLFIDDSTLPKHSKEQFEAWVKFQVGAHGGIRLDNPLAELDIEVKKCEFKGK